MRSQFLLSGLISALAVLSPAAELTGRVLSDGKGVVGATVQALPYETPHAFALREAKGEAALAPLAIATTSADGRFKLSVAIEAPPFVVRATFGGLAARLVEGVFEKTDTAELGEISLGPGETVSGRVVDASSNPVPGALVRIGRDGVPTTTTKEGLFRFDDIEGRTGRAFTAPPLLSVHAAGFEVQAGPVRFSAAPVTIRLKPSTARFLGTLKDWNGRPAADAVVRIVGNAVTRWARVDPLGRFDIPGFPPKQGRLQALGKDGSSLNVVVPKDGASAPFAMGQGATIQGRVTRLDDGKFVPGVKVVARSGATTAMGRTGVDGRYRITGLPQDSYRVKFDEPRFVLLDRRAIDLTPGELKTLDVALTEAATLVGRVSDERGQAVSGAHGTLGPGSESRIEMMLRGVGRDGADGADGAAFVSGLNGTFKATRLAPGTNQKLTVTHPDFERRVIPGVDLAASAPKPLSVEVVLSSGFALSGIVRDKEGQPISGADVSLSRSVRLQSGGGGSMFAFNAIGGVRPQAQTDFEGKFGFAGLSAGDYDLTISKSGFTRSVSNGVKAGEGASPLAVVLNPGASIGGRLIQTNGQPVTGYSVSARPSTTEATTEASAGMMMMGGRGTTAQVDPDGCFLIDGLTPATAYDLSLFGQGEFRGDAKKKSVVAPASDVEIEVATRGRIAGRVVDAATSTPVTDFEASYAPGRTGGMRIVMRSGPGDGDRRTPFSSSEGAFAFEDVPPGNWDVTVWAKTYQEARTGGIAVLPGETKTVEVKASRGLVIRGRVVDAKGGRGVQDASVSARDAGGGGGGAFVFDAGRFGGGGVITDADGRFEIVDQGPGVYQLTAQHPLYSEGTARATLEDKDAVAEIPLVAGSAIAGLVTSSQGAPLAGAEVSLQNSGGGGGMRFGMDGQTSLTDGGGRFRFDHLAPSRYKLSATLRTETSASIDIPLIAGDVREDIRLTLDAGATVRGVVSGLKENERGGVEVWAQGSSDYFSNTRTNADGSFEFSGVPKGTLLLRATAGDMVFGSSRTAIKELTLADGQTEISTEIVFDDGLSISGTVLRRGVPVGGARVSALTGGGRQASATADENGSFRISGLEAGRVGVVAFAENFESQVSQVVELKADTSIELVIPTAKLAGGVFDASTGLPLESSVEVVRVATSTGSPRSRLNVTTDSSGRFGFDDLEPVDYRITARRSGYESVTSTLQPTEAGVDLRLELKRGAGLAIEAKDGQMGFGLRGLFVRVQGGATDAFAGLVTLDGEGRGEIPGIPPGSYTVLAQATGYAPVMVQNVQAPSTTLRLSLSPGGAVEFR
ncbi:MAG: carboxypeptidase regulatory-like domain-containing protein, partial [Vicinamibacteria bacterium]|nr:carboxypeptidase regulatory-like domain-containing protein [Vicinamibacteria bacterium]